VPSVGDGTAFWRPDEVKTLRIRSFDRLRGLVPAPLESDSLIGETEREILELAIAIHTGNDAGPGDIPENMTDEEATQLPTKLVATQQCFSWPLDPLGASPLSPPPGPLVRDQGIPGRIHPAAPKSRRRERRQR
jgi:hypothetical protein